MRADSIVFGSRRHAVRRHRRLDSRAASRPGPARAGRRSRGPGAAGRGQAAQPGSRAVPLDQDRVRRRSKRSPQQNPKDAQPRVQLGNMFFDAEQYPQAITWYEQAMRAQPDRTRTCPPISASRTTTRTSPIARSPQFEHSLSLDPKHTKTLLNMGIVRAFGKQDLDGAARRGSRSSRSRPNSQEGQAAKKGLEGLQNAHPPGSTGGQVSRAAPRAAPPPVLRCSWRAPSGGCSRAWRGARWAESAATPSAAGVGRADGGQDGAVSGLRHLRRARQGASAAVSRGQVVYFCSDDCRGRHRAR